MEAQVVHKGQHILKHVSGDISYSKGGWLDITSVKGALDWLKENAVGEVTEATAVHTNTTTFTGALSATDVNVQLALNKLDQYCATVSGTAQTATTDIITISGRVSSAESDITQNSNDIITLSGRVSSAEADIIQNANDIITTSGRVNSTEADIITLSGRITSTEADITQAQADIITISGRVSSAESDIIQNSNNIITLSGRLTSAEGDITQNSNSITTISGQVAALESDMTQVQADIATVSGLIPSNLDDLNDVEISSAEVDQVLGWDGSVWKNMTTASGVGNRTINAQTGTTYTFVLSDTGKICTFSNADPITVTVPKNAVVAFEDGAQIDCIQTGAGKVTFAPVDGDVTIRSQVSNKAIAAQYVGVSLLKIDTNEWVLFGNLIA